MLEPFTSAIAANRFGLGARPGELAAIGGDAARLAASAARRPAAADRRMLELQLLGRHARRGARAAARDPGSARNGSGADDGATPCKKLPQLLRPIYVARSDGALAQRRDAASGRSSSA